MYNSIKIIRPSELSQALGISEVTIWRMEKEGILPKRKQLSSRCVGWLVSDIEEWLENRPNTLELNNEGTK